MSSAIDPTVIQDDQKIDKADLRTQFGIAKNEITALQLISALPRKMMYDDLFFDNL